VIAVVVGPTAVGKSAVAVALAERLTAADRPAEIVNADSMALYRGMDIGTAKPSAEERAAVPHHLLDVLDISQAASVAEFQTLARAVIAACRARGVLPIVVGGSALYIRAILDRFDFPGTDPALRAELEQELALVGPYALHARLAELDPPAAERILPGNGRRIVRALEVIELTGQPFGAELPAPDYALPDVVQVGLDIDRPRLDERIAHRVNGMWERGFVVEVAALAERGLASTPTASRALGYRQVLDHLTGRISEEEARARTIAATRRFARRQLAWFRRDPRIHWLGFDHPDRVALALESLSESLSDGRPSASGA
jgi:tRNA dimethylallyltransferase